MYLFLGGVVVGALGMLLVYRNNKSKMTAIADKLSKKVGELEDKIKKQD